MFTAAIRRGSKLLAAAAIAAVTITAGGQSAGAGVTASTGEVFWISDFSQVDGASVHARITPGGANLSIHTTGLTAGNAYTLWSISFSNPGACEHGMAPRLCGPGDDGPGPQGFAVQLVGGHMVGASGHLTIAGQVDVENAAGAEYHLVVADHGPMDPKLLPGQIKTPGPGVQVGFIIPS